MRRYQLIPSHAVQTLLITSVSPLPSGEIGVPYSFTFNAIGGVGPYSWSEVGAIPSGLTFSGGTLSGTPTGTFSSSFNVTVTDSVGSQFTRAFSLTVITAVQITTASPLPGGTVGVAYSTTIAATGGAMPYSWSILGFTGANSYSINSVTGMLTGTLGVAEIDSINIQVVDALGIPSAKNFNLTVIPAASLTITTSSPLPAATQSSAYSTTMAATGGTPPYTWSLTSHTGTNTWSVSSGGVVTGTPGTIETDSLVIKVTDSVLATASGTFSLTVSAPVSGFLPAGHWIPAKLPMALVYPRPDAETGTFARHRWAYYDGVNPVQYKIPIGVNFGAFPYVFSLDAGSIALGMSIQAPYWNTAWASTGTQSAFQQALAAGYGYLTWTPSASISGHTVTITVTDQQMNTLTIAFTVSTSSATSRFIFIDSVNGNDSTGTGSISAPWASFVKANGTLFSTTTNANAICYLRQGTYAILPQSDSGNGTNLNSGWITCQFATSRKPSAFIGFPGDTPPVLSMTQCLFGAAQNSGLNDAEDFFMQGLNPNGYLTTQQSFRFFWGTQGQRITFDQIQWTNSGFGSSAPNNGTGYFIDGAGGGAMQYVFLNGTSETNRQSGNSGNNYGGCSFYTCSNSLVQGNAIIDPTLIMDEAYQPKSDVSNSCWRGNYVISSGCQYFCSPLQAIIPSYNNFEISYNAMVSSGGQMAVPVAVNFPYGTLWCLRNSVRQSNGIICGTPNNAGPYVFDSNASQGGSIPSGSSVQSDGLNIFSAGLLDANGNLTAGFSSSLGKVGAQIA